MTWDPHLESVRRGTAATLIHPDLKPGGIDFETAAADIVADILHAVFGSSILERLEADHGWPTRFGLSPEVLLERALRHFRDEQAMRSTAI